VRPFYYQLRNELWKLFGKKRTYIGFGMFLLAEAALILLLRYTHGPRRDMVRRLELMGYPADQFLSNLTMAMAMMVPVAYVLMPLYVALVGGDLVAKEAEDGTLRMILSRPISRLRLVTIKWLAGTVFSLVLVLVLGVSGVIFASCFFPPGSMFALLPMEGIFGLFDAHAGFTRYASAIGLLTVKAVTVMGLGWMFSCFNMKPAAATILALSVFMVSRLIQEIPYFHDLQGWFLTYHLNFWMKVFVQPIPWPDICESLCILFGYNLTFFIVGSAAFQVRDIKS
jgi:ABC-2 type transport system permease protein